MSACRSGEASWWLAALLLALQASALRPHFLCWSCCPPLPSYVLLLVWSDCKQGLRRLRQGGWGYREARTRLPGWEGALGGLCSPGAAGRRGSAPAKKSAAATGSARTGGASPFLVHPKLGSEVTLGCGRHCVRFLPAWVGTLSCGHLASWRRNTDRQEDHTGSGTCGRQQTRSSSRIVRQRSLARPPLRFRACDGMHA